MRQHPDDNEDQDLDHYEDEDLEELSTPVYQGSGLSVRALTAEELQRFLDAHHGQPAELLGSGWAALDPPGRPLGEPPAPPAATLPVVPAEPVTGSLGSPGRSALAAYRRRRAEELAGWTRGLAWRAPLVAAAGLVVQVLAIQLGLPQGGTGRPGGGRAGWLAAAVSRLRAGAHLAAWRGRGAADRPAARPPYRDGFVVFHDLAVPGSSANVDHLAIGPTGVFVIDSKRWSGTVHQSADGLAWHNHYPLDRTLETVRWEAGVIGRLLGTRTAGLVCVHGAHVHGGGLHALGVAIVPAHLLRSALGCDRVLSDADVALLATSARSSLRPAA